MWKEVGWYYRQGTRSDEAIEPIGYPFAANTMLLVYNKHFFDDPALQRQYRIAYNADLRPAQRWDEFKHQADFFKKFSTAHCGVALEGKTDAWLYYEWMNFLFGYGGKVMDKKYGWQGNADTNLELNTPVAIEAATAYKALKPDACGDFFNMDAPTQREALLSGNVPMAIMWSDYLFELAHGKAKKGSSFGYAPVPGGKSMIAGGSYYINKLSKHPDFAAQFIFSSRTGEPSDSRQERPVFSASVDLSATRKHPRRPVSGRTRSITGTAERTCWKRGRTRT